MAERRPRWAVPAAAAVALLLAACAAGGATTGRGSTASTPSLTPVPSSSATSTPAHAHRHRHHAADGVPAHGRVLAVTIPAVTSNFRPRIGAVYLPPILAVQPHRALPVLELLHGIPGRPINWFTHGRLASAMDAFADAHGGLAPLVVLPDDNGADVYDSECVHGLRGTDVEQYLTTDVPRWVEAHYATLSGASHWAIGGNSEGGMCSLMLTLRHTDRYATFLNLSGLARPTVGDTDDPALTIQKLFGGSQADYTAHDPTALLREHRYPQVGGWFEASTGDPFVLAAQQEVVPLARAAGIDVRTEVIPGSHSWGLWRTGIVRLLPWLWARIAPPS